MEITIRTKLVIWILQGLAKTIVELLRIMITHTWLITSRTIMDATGFQQSPHRQFPIVLSPGGILVMPFFLRNRFSFEKRTITA
jgi:hypothetical protein